MDYSVIESLIESLGKLNGTHWDLPKKAISRESTSYIVTGRYRGYGNSDTEDYLCKGNPLDIIAHFIEHNDYFSQNRHGETTNNVYDNRALILASEFAKKGNKWTFANPDLVWTFNKKITFEYTNEVLVPKIEVIAPEEIDNYWGYQVLEDLKTKKGFVKIASEILEPKKVSALVKHLF